MEYKFRKILTMTLITIMSTSALVGCGKSQEQSKDAKFEKIKGNGTEITILNNKVKDDYKVRVRYSAALCGAAPVIAKEKNFFEKNGVNVEMIKSAESSASDLLATHKVDVAQGMIPSTALKLENGLNVKFSLGIHTGCFYIIAGKNNDSVNSVKDLKNKKIAVSSLSGDGAALARRALAYYGIDSSQNKDEVKFVTYPESEMALALKKGQVDAIAIDDPRASTILHDGIGKAIISNGTDEHFKNEVCCALLMSPKFIKEHPVLADKVNKSIKEAGKWVKEHPAETVKIQIDKGYIPAGNPELYAKTLASYRWEMTSEEGKESLMRNLKELQKLNILKPSTNIEKLFDNSFVKFK